MSLVKTSIMVFYLNIFGTKRSFRVSVAITMTIVWLWAISVVLETLLLCRPLAFNWDTTIPGGGCGNRNATYVLGLGRRLDLLDCLWLLNGETFRTDTGGEAMSNKPAPACSGAPSEEWPVPPSTDSQSSP
ncbi:uncharacterized protein BDV17DRAFT_293307 [Aspergillus undulatus]|uniref:uncharacterized protein n=1 Tax=Aspergillus undulatus TaxID=1810928 RepID=UPI003CCDAFE5